MIRKLKQMLFLWKRVKNVFIYEFPINKKGEKQIWTPYVAKDRKYLIDYVNNFNYIQKLNHLVYNEVLPDVVMAFLQNNDAINSVIEDMEDEEKLLLTDEVLETFSGLNIVFPVTKLNSTEFSGILPDGRFTSNLTIFEANEIVESRFKTNCVDSIFTDDVFFSFDCPFCGVPYNFKSPEEIPESNMCCGNCDNMLIQYTGKDTGYFFSYSLDKDSIEYLEKLKLKKSVVNK
jgi:hypothetical protein